MTFGRFAIAALALLFAWLLLERKKAVRPTARDLALLTGMALTGVLGYTFLFLHGVAKAPASDGTVITPALAGLSGIAVAWAALRQRPGGRELGGAVFGLAGAVLVGWTAFQAAGFGSERITGDLSFAAAAFTWGVYTLLGKRAAERIPVLTGVLLATAIGAAIFAPVALLVEGPGMFAGWSALAWANVLYLALVATALAFVTYYLGVQRVGVAGAAPFLGLIPLFGVAQAALLLGEAVTPLHVAGGALVLAGIALPSLLQRRAAARARAAPVVSPAE